MLAVHFLDIDWFHFLHFVPDYSAEILHCTVLIQYRTGTVEYSISYCMYYSVPESAYFSSFIAILYEP